MMPDWAADLEVYFVASGSPERVLKAVEVALQAGVRTVQLRLKDVDTPTLYQSALEMRRLSDRSGALFIMNDRVDIALAVGADGVHLGPKDLPVSAVRRIVPEGFIVGASAGTSADAARLVGAGADYLGVGAIYDASGTKADASAPRGVGVIAEIARLVPVPIVAIGGIHRDNAAACFQAGAAGVAVVRALMQHSTSQDMKDEVDALLAGKRP